MDRFLESLDISKKKIRQLVLVAGYAGLMSVTATTVAGIATQDMNDQIRLTPQATMGALEVGSTVVAVSPPSVPSGLFLTIVRN